MSSIDHSDAEPNRNSSAEKKSSATNNDTSRDLANSEAPETLDQFKRGWGAGAETDDDASVAGSSTETDDRYYLPARGYPIRRAARRIFTALAKLLCLFIHAGEVVEVVLTGGQAELRTVTPAAFRSRCEDVGELWRDGVDNKGKRISRPSRCSLDDAQGLLASREAELLPHLSTLSAAPILTLSNTGSPVVLNRHGYHAELGGVFVASWRPPADPPPEEAAAALLKILNGFRFATPADKTRAIAALLTPAILNGRLLGEARVPMFVIEADYSQAGKGYLAALVAAVYGERPTNVVPRKGGVGSFDEDFNATLLKGSPFVMLDNLRGKLDSSHIESFMTAFGPFNARTVHRPPVPIDRSRYVLFATSNGFTTTADLENRSLRIALKKQRPGYTFDMYDNGTKHVLTYVRARQSFYLGCVFSVLREWIAAGRPRTGETRHSFREWAQSLDWILLNTFQDELPGRLMDFDAPKNGDLVNDLDFEEPEDGDNNDTDIDGAGAAPIP